MGHVYVITNIVNNQQYVGVVLKKGKTIEDRFKEHIRSAHNGLTTLLCAAIREFGEDKFQVSEILSSNDHESLLLLERFYINKFNTNRTAGGNGYNMTSGGQGTFGLKWNTEAKQNVKVPMIIDKAEFEHDLQTLTWGEISVKYKVSNSAARTWANELGLVKSRVQRKFHNQSEGKWLLSQEDELIDMYLSGIANNIIADKLGRSLSSVEVKLTRIKKIRGITVRRRANRWRTRRDEDLLPS